MTPTEQNPPFAMDTDGEAIDVWASPRVRDELSGLVRRDLLGPWDGDEEILIRVGPRDRYVVGMLAPQDVGSDDPDAVGDDEDLDSGEFGDGSEDKPTAGTSALRLFPSSMGVTFTVADTVDELAVSASWGRYEKTHDVLLEEGAAASDRIPGTAVVVSEPTGDAELVVNDDDGKKAGKKPWVRRPIVGRVTVDLTGSPVSDDEPFIGEARANDAAAPNVWVRWLVRRRPGGLRVVSVFLINRQTRAEFDHVGVDASWLYQAGMEVTAVNGRTPVFVPGAADAGFVGDGEDTEQAGLAMLYRNTPEYAAGHGVAVTWDEPGDVSPAKRRAWRIQTDSMPTFDVAQTSAPTSAQISGFADLVLDMSVLADAPDGAGAAEMLRPLVMSYREWIGQQDARIGTDADLAPFTMVAKENVAKARAAADRIERGIDLLAGNGQAWEAFRFANQAMALQRRHTEATVLRRADPSLSLKKALAASDVQVKRSWRPFQIAFVLLNLPALADAGHAERAAGEPGQPDADGAIADLLFFPTGGGKTEAYLGLTAFTFAIRRLQGHIEGLDGSRGVAVLMRYTLRLLTSQQLQRAATLVAATEMIRRKDMAGGRQLWGSEPFRIGLWVGGAVTPNRFDDAYSAIEAAKGFSRATGRSSVSPVPFTECPWCGTTINVKTDVEPDKTARRVFIYCGDTSGACDFTKARNRDGLPVLTVDEEIYRYPPSLLIATVDKFAQLPRNGAAGHLFGHVTKECSRHGFKHSDIRDEVCGANEHRATGGLPAAATSTATRLRPIDLIIQDELHLIADALGTMVGLYETAVDELATWTVNGKRVRPKVVASTATVRRAEEQAYSLFRRPLAVFPPPVLDVEDSFFALRVPVDEDHPGRRYLGVCAQGIRLKSVEIRVTSSIMAFAQMLFDDHGSAADPYMTLVAYFNALRELGGMRRLVEDDIAARLSRPLHPILPKRRNPGGFLDELTSRVASSKIKQTLKVLDVAFNPDVDTTAARTAAVKAAKDPVKKKGKTPAITPAADVVLFPRDVLLATNMFAVGVDISRLGLMTVTGQPKATSEYIQATSRVGRDAARPGLVVTIYNWARPRDLSHFERFGHYHAAFYQQVEALSVTPFSVPALNRAITGAFLGALRHLDPQYNPDTGLNAVNIDDPEVVRLINVFADRAAAVTGRQENADEVRSLLDKRLRALASRKANAAGQSLLAYKGGKQGQVGVLRDPESGTGWDMWTVPNSLRETEPEINLQLLPYDPTLADPSANVPLWRSTGTSTPSAGGTNA